MVLDTIIIMVYKAIMGARKLFYHKETRGDVVLEMVIWQLPCTAKQQSHGLNTDFSAERWEPVLCATTTKQEK